MIDDILFAYIICKLKERMRGIIIKKIGLYLKTLSALGVIDPKKQLFVASLKNYSDKLEIIEIKKIDTSGTPYIISIEDALMQLRFALENPPKEEVYYSLTSTDLDNYIQTMEIKIDGVIMLQDSQGIIYDSTPENNIIGKLNHENKIEWYRHSYNANATMTTMTTMTTTTTTTMPS
jgi:hypothetical protein